MGDPRPGLGPELQQLAHAIVSMIDPLVQAAAASASGGEPGKCQQVWCPVCAAAAVITGEEHPLVTILAEHTATLLALIGAMASARDPAGVADDHESPSPPGRYEAIPVTILD